jgi:tape measure domain-containing protein|nr:MAG TPA: tail tape measure protein [Caudoviricetes sp.]
MPYLSFDVDADYSELIRLQQEIAKTKSQLQNFRPGQAGASIDALNKKLAESTARYRQLVQAAIRSGADMEFGIKKNLSGIFTEVNRIQDLLTRPMMAVGGLAGVYGLGEFLTKITSIRGQFQQMNASIETMIGKRKGEKLNAELQEFAKISPLEFAPTVSTAQMMLGFGIDADKVPRYLQAIGDIAMGDTRRFQSLSLAFSQMSAAGKLMGQDLMQMVNAGFQPLQVISEKTGKSIGALKEEMSQGKISAEMVQQAFLDATSEGGKYYKMSETASKTIPGAIAKLNDSMDLMLNDMGQNMEGALVGAIDAASTIVDNIGRIIPVLATAAAAFGVYKTSVMLSNFAAKQSVIDASQGIVDGFNAELAKIQEMQNAKMMEGYDDDIRKALEKGSIDQTYADAIQQGRLWQQEQQRIAENERRIAEEAQQTYETHLKDMLTQREQAGRGLDADINDSNANGIITNDTAERLQNERDYAQALVDTKQAALDSANMQKAASDQLVEAAERRVESAKELMEMAEAAGDANDKKAAAEEYMAAVEEQASAITTQQSAAEGVNTAEKELNGAITAQQAVQKQTATAAVIGETTATTANTAATNVNTAATSRGTIVTALATAKDKALTIGKYALTAATNACKNAWNSLKVAFMTNPFGMIITALTTVIGLFMSFKDEAEESSAMSERFGESTLKLKNNIDTLYAVMNSVNKDSRVHKDAVEELIKMAEEYGIHIDKEKDKIEQLNEVRAQLNQLILAEGEARQMANRLATIQEEKDAATTSFKDEMKEIIENDSSGEAAEVSKIMADTIASTVENKKAELTQMVKLLEDAEKEYAANITYTENGQKIENAAAIKARQEIARLQTEIAQTANMDAKALAKQMGFAEQYVLDIKDTSKLVSELINKTNTLDKLTEKTQAQANAAADAAERAAAAQPEIDYSTFDSKKLTEELTKVSKEVDEINAKPVKPLADPINIHELFEAAGQAEEKIGDVDESSATPTTDNTALDETSVKAAQAEDKMKDVDNAVATPYIDTKYLDIALNTLDKIKITLRDVGGQVLNTTGAERQTLQNLLAKYGKNGKIASDTKMAKADADAYNAIVRNARLRSNFKMGGKNYHLNSEQSAILQQFIDRYGTTLNEGNMSAVDKRLYRQLRNDLMVGEYNRNKGNQSQAMQSIKTALESQIKNAKTTEEFSEIRKSINAQMQKVDQSSALYKYYEQQLKALDKRDKSKKGSGGSKDDPKQRAYELRKMRLEEERRTAELLQEERNNQRELEIAQMEDNSEKEIATIKFTAEKKRQALLKEAEREAQTLEKNALQEWLKGGKGRKEYQYYAQFSDEQLKKMREDWLTQAKDNIGFDTQSQLINVNESNDLEARFKEDFAAMRDYLKEFGSFQQKKLAIAEEYAEKIRNAQSEGERLALQRQQKAEEEQFESKAVMNQIDWYTVFDNVGVIMRGQLEPLYEQLQKYVKTEAFRQSGAENQQAIIEAMENMRQQLGTNQTWQDLSSSLMAYQKALDDLRIATENDTRVTAELSRLTNTQTEAQRNLEMIRNNPETSPEQLRAAQEAYENATIAVNNYGTTVANSNLALQQAQNTVKSSGMMLSQTAKNVIKPVSKIYTFLSNSGFSQLADLWGAFDSLKGAIDGLKGLSAFEEASKAITDLKDAAAEGAEAFASALEDSPQLIKDAMTKLGLSFEDFSDSASGAADKLSSEITGVVSEAGDAVSEASQAVGSMAKGLGKAGLIAGLIASILKILDILKDGLGPLITAILDSILNAISGIIGNILNFKEGLFRQIGESLYKGILGIFKSIFTLGGWFDWWGNGESDKHLEEDIERLTATNEALRKAVDNLADEMRDAATADMGALYQQQKGDLEQSMKNTQEMMSRSGAAYSNGFLGIGGHHSSNYKINKGMSGDDWSRISAIVDKSVRSAGDFWNLTSEQMAKVAQSAPDLYAKIKGLADDGHKDAAQFMDEYIEYYKELEELENAFRESLTDVSFDSVKDEFKSMLLDMESDSEDFANNFEKMMQQAVINSLMNSKYNEKLKQWYEDFANAMNDKDGLTAAEQERLKRDWDDIVGDAVNDRNNLKKAMGWDGSSEQQSSSRTLEGMSQDTGNAIEGRLTALQIAVESIRANEGQHTLSLADMTDELLQIAMEYSRFNVHQDNIERQLAKIYIELQTISENTGAIVKPIQTMQADIAEIKKNTKNI